MVISCYTQLCAVFSSHSHCTGSVRSERSGPELQCQQPGHARRDGAPSSALLPCPGRPQGAGSGLRREEVPAAPAPPDFCLALGSKTTAVSLRAFPHLAFFVCFPPAPGQGEIRSPLCYRYAKYHLNTVYVSCLGTHQ